MPIDVQVPFCAPNKCSRICWLMLRSACFPEESCLSARIIKLVFEFKKAEGSGVRGSDQNT
jgi:hypothetical protein